MLSIKNFRLNRKKNILELNEDLKAYINAFVTNENYALFIEKSAKFLDLQKKTIFNESKVFIFRNFINRHGKFNEKLSKGYFKYFLINLIFIICIFVSKKKKPNIKKKYDLVVDLTENTQYYYFNKIAQKIKTVFILEKKDQRFNYFIFNKFFKYTLSEKAKSFFSFQFFILKWFYISHKEKINFNYILFHFFKLYFRNHSIFLNIEAKFLIQERYNFTSPIKNEIFREYGGILSTVIQRNIFQRNGPGMYIYSDVIFSLGKETCKILEDLGGEVRETYPVGSFFMEKNFFDRPQSTINNNLIEKFDLLIIAAPHIWDFISGYDSYYDDYYLHFEWIKKFAIENPNLTIGIKHKDKLENLKEIEIFKNIRNVKHVIDKTKWKDTYLYGKLAKSVCTWSSTLGHELLSIKKECYYIDPNYKNQSFIPDYNFYKPLRLNTYKKFERTVKDHISGKKNISILNNSDKFCMNSENVSLKIVKFFQNRLK